MILFGSLKVTTGYQHVPTNSMVSLARQGLLILHRHPHPSIRLPQDGRLLRADLCNRQSKPRALLDAALRPFHLPVFIKQCGPSPSAGMPFPVPVRLPGKANALV